MSPMAPPATAAAIAVGGPDVVATALRILGAITGQGTSAATAGLTDSTVSDATTAVPSGGASPGGGVGVIGAPSNLLLGSSYGPFYGVPPTPRPFSATAFLRGLSPRPPPSRPPTAPLLRPWRTPRARQPPLRSACVWPPSPGSMSVPPLTLLLATSPRRSAFSTPLRGSASPLLLLRLHSSQVLDPRVARTTPWSPTSTFRPPGSRTSRTW
jgi:hypothetical protein